MVPEEPTEKLVKPAYGNATVRERKDVKDTLTERVRKMGEVYL
jgi:hypothetical protein